jgi:hypothetical protein
MLLYIRQPKTFVLKALSRPLMLTKFVFAAELLTLGWQKFQETLQKY